ncbi:MAG TPA: T9SS type A sorting domain-containing protein [Niastella sp.]
MRRHILYTIVFAISIVCSFLNTSAQSPGQIVRRLSQNPVLDFNNDGYTSTNSSGFTTSDITQSEIPFKTIPPAFVEPVGDLATGSSGSFTDLVTSSTDKSGFVAYYDGTNLIFRLRVGSISAGAKGYSILIDADFKAGNSGSQPDPNYVAPTAQGTGNIGFEWEVLLATGNSTTVTVYETDGKIGPDIVQKYQTSGNSWQISTALTTNSNGPDYFYDFYVPISVFTGTYAITGSTPFRFVATTVTSPTSALTGSRSDIFGVNDVNYSSTPDGWLAALNGTPPVTLTSLSSGSVGGICTNPPVITSSSVVIGSGQSISGTWTRRDASSDANATITVYRYSSAGTLLNTYTSTSAYPGGVATGGSWTITGITAASGDYFVAKAKGTNATLNESECLQSNTIYTTCSATINPTVLTASGSKGICGSLTTGATAALIYKMDATGNTLMNPSNSNTTYTATTFTWYTCSGGTSNVANGTYMVILTGGGCQSTPVFDCISSGNGSLAGLAVNTGITFPATLYPFNDTLAGSVPASASVQMATLFINNVLTATVSIPANTTGYVFRGLKLNANDNIKVYLSGANCTVYNSTTVLCYNQPPIITTDANGKLLAGATTISGTSAASASITLNRVTTTTASWTTTANSSGAWSVTVPALTAGDTYTATVTAAGGCSTASAASSTATVATVTTTCPVFTNTPYNDANTIVHGTVNVTTTGSIVRLYVDGALAGSQTFNTPPTGTLNWDITSSLPLYYGAVLKATFQAGATASEKTDCTTTTVICTSPATPGISPASTTINAGQTVPYTVSGAAPTTWYAVRDNTGISYATSIYNVAATSFGVTTSAFNTPGTYNLLLSADKLTGCPASTAAATVVVNAVVTPVRFVNINARKTSAGNVVSWIVSDEADVNHYEIEKSFDGINFGVIGSVKYKQATGAENKYSYTDVTAAGSEKLYYRIRQVDNNQIYTLSSIVMVKASETLFQVWPNPTSGQVNVNILVGSSQSTYVELLDLTGSILLSKPVHLVTGTNSVLVKELNTFTPGIYIFKVFADGENHMQKIVIK